MNSEFLVLAQRIHQDLGDIKLIVGRAERAIKAIHLFYFGRLCLNAT